MVGNSGSRKWIGVSLALALSAGFLFFLIEFFPTASNQGYAPVQPIPFSHKRHAGEFKMPCLYCHSGAEHSAHASVPSLNVCMSCHHVVKTDSPYIQTIQKAYSEGRPIEWVRVHELPDYVNFSHKRHVAKGLDCQTCHGHVQEMERLEQKQPLTMGWCMECHRGETTPREVLAQVYPNRPNHRGPVAPVNCNTCHH